MTEVIDIEFNDLSNLEPVKLNLNDDNNKTVNFGPGIELLMNENNRKHGSNNINVDLGELDNLEKELNELSSNIPKSSNNEGGGGFTSNLFNFPSFKGFGDSNKEIKLNSNLGQATKETVENTKTWDGFSKINDFLPDKPHTNLNERDKRKKKRMMIKKMEEWCEKGIMKKNVNFDMDSPYEEIEDEYENALDDKRRKDSIKLQGWWFMTFVNSVEYANAAFNPFDLNLDGWGEQVSEDIESYDEIFHELYEKYKGGKLSPELSLLLRLGFSAAVVNFTNKALSTATPGFNDVIRQSPELMKLFTNATVDSMKQSSPGFSMASNLMNNPEQINKSFGPPPPPVETKNQPSFANRPGNNMHFTKSMDNRQDIDMARGIMMREKGVDLHNQYSDYSTKPPPTQSTYQPPPPPPPSNTSGFRNEMKGPQSVDLDNILSGLKTKTINIHENSSAGLPTDDDSMISISSLKDLQNNNPPKKSRGRRKSDKNVVTLDI